MKNPKVCVLQDLVKRHGYVVMTIASCNFYFIVVDPMLSKRHISGFSKFVNLTNLQMRALIYKAFYVRKKIGQLASFYRNLPKRAIAFNYKQRSLLLCPPTSFMFDAVFVTRLVSAKFLIRFKNTAEPFNNFRTSIHHIFQGMTNFLGSLLPNDNPLFQKDRGNSLARKGNVINGQ